MPQWRISQETQSGAVNTQMQAELEALRAKNQLMEEDLAMLKARKVEGTKMVLEADDEFDGMNDHQLRDFITTHSGSAPHGMLGRKNLLRLAREAAPKENAA